jgi:hypothetical protein
MERIQFAKIKGSSRAKGVRAQSGKMSFRPELARDMLSGSLDVGMVRKSIVAFADVYSSKFAGPLIYIAKQMPVNLSEMCKVERTHNWS